MTDERFKQAAKLYTDAFNMVKDLISFEEKYGRVKYVRELEDVREIMSKILLDRLMIEADAAPQRSKAITD